MLVQAAGPVAIWCACWEPAVSHNDAYVTTTDGENLRAIASRELHSKHSSPIVFIESGLEPLVLYADLGGFVSAQ